ncbi:MAG: GNAT family N-acetyltransferase [Acidobacteriota bacterium]
MNGEAFPDMIESPRLILRRYRPLDAPAVLALVGRNRMVLMREFEQQASLWNLDEAQRFIATKQEQWETGKAFCYGIWLRQEKRPIGQIQVKNIDWKIPAAELGYFIDGSLRRQGLASESIRRVVALMLEDLGFRRLFVRILPSNPASLALAAKLGFRNEGLHRMAFRCGLGELHDVHHLSLTLEDYRSGRA